MVQVLRICMLNADTPVPVVAVERAPTYGRIFHNLLSSSAASNELSRYSSQNALHITSTDFNVVKNEYPASVAEFDAIILSGSANAAYDDSPWVRKLERWVKEVYENEPNTKIFGSCFGHQLICQALLKEFGVKAEKDLKGWELGVKEITLHQRFHDVFLGHGDEARTCSPGTMRLQFLHHDHVVVPDLDALPPSWMTVGTTQHCAVQGVYEPGRVLTFQGHFEFDRFITSETIKYFFPNWQPKFMEEMLKAIDADDDSVMAAGMILKFFLEDSIGRHGQSPAVTGGLITRPSRE